MAVILPDLRGVHSVGCADGGATRPLMAEHREVRVTFHEPPGEPYHGRPYGAGRARPPMPRPQFPRWGKPLLITIAALVVLAVAIGVFVALDTEHLWFDSVGYGKVFTTQVWVRIAMFCGFGGFMAAVLLANVYLAYRLRPAFRASSPEQRALERYRHVIEPRRWWFFAVAAVFFGLIFGSAASGKWKTWMMWANATSFGHKDPQFHRDVSYYAFVYPFQRFILGYVMALVVVCTIVTLVVHYLFGGIAFRTPGDRLTRGARAHIASLLFVFVVCKAIAYYLDRFGLAFSSRGVVTGPSYTDVHAVLPAKSILAVIALFCAVLFFATIFRSGWLLPAASFGLLVLSAVIIGGVYPLIVQNFQVKPSEADKESPYIQRNIDQTRYAYGLDNVKVTAYDATTNPSASALTDNTATGAGVRLLDNAVLPPTYNQLQQFRNFYNIDKLDVDRYVINGQEQDAVVATRELNLSGVPSTQKTWINEHLVYTHGYGFVAAPGNGVDSDGRPAFIEQNIPVTGSLGDFEPRVYFGEGETSFSVVGAPAGAAPREYDFPTNGGNGQQYNTYDGGGGVPIGSTFRRLEYALRFGDKNLLLSDGINSQSRILYDRDPRQRVAKVAPYLTLDGDPYSAIVDGRLLWIVDGYTTSDGFPYAQRENLNSITQDTNTETATTHAQAKEQINYLRNSVKATVDAYTGAVTLYAWDASDPVLRTWMKVFPGTVKPKSAMSTQLLAHVRYPEDMFKVQRKLLANYHVTDPHAFYGQQDFWLVPADPTQSGNSQPDQPPYYLTLKMPDQSEPAFSLTTTFVPRGRPNLSAFMAVNSDPGPDYGTIRVLELPRSSTVSGPGQVQNQFEADPGVQSQLNILRVQGGAAGVVYGNLLTLPVAGGLLYVEPVYVKASGGQGSYPLQQKVLVSFGDRIGFESTYSAAVASLVKATPGSGAPPPPSGQPSGSPSPSPSASPTAPGGLTAAQLIADAQAAYAAGQQALAKGDFATYGDKQKQVSDDLDKLAKLLGTPSPSAPGGGSGAPTSPSRSP
jgi:uncharacterized membrane protein (UPF0182 family)